MRYTVSTIAGVTMAVMMLLGYSYQAGTQETGPKLAYINSAQIIENTPGSIEAQATFEREMATWQTEVQVLADSLQQLLTQYEQQQVLLSPEKREERQQEILVKRQEYNRRVEGLQTAAQTRQAELVQPIYDKISAVLADIRDEQNYAMIFDVAAGALIAADTTLDITSQVIDRLAVAAQAANPN
ncbi:MAG: OmpH family outer membrane protein [Gemmatimonadota bacterium]|nr:OmpH family outer membrane protein [Candidatus Palauibacterales bacterium]